MAPPSNLTEQRLRLIYTGEGFGGDNTMRAKVIRELIDEIHALREELHQRRAVAPDIEVEVVDPTSATDSG
jgi:hypothetical protein